MSICLYRERKREGVTERERERKGMKELEKRQGERELALSPFHGAYA